MKHITFWLVLIFIAVGIQVVGRMSPKAKAAKKIEPASVSKIDGSDLKRLTLLPGGQTARHPDGAGSRGNN